MKQRHCILFDRRCKNTCYYFVGKGVVFFLPPLISHLDLFPSVPYPATIIGLAILGLGLTSRGRDRSNLAKLR
jgi:hypothetical protein